MLDFMEYMGIITIALIPEIVSIVCYYFKENDNA